MIMVSVKVPINSFAFAVKGIFYSFYNAHPQLRYMGRQPLVEFEYSTLRETRPRPRPRQRPRPRPTSRPIPRPQRDEVARFVWSHGRWTACSKECGDGT